MRAVVAMVALLLLPLTAFPDSLGDAARKEAERRARSRASGVKAPTYRDGDVRTHAPDDAVTAAPSPKPSASPTPDQAQGRRELARDEEKRRQEEQAWRQRAAAIRYQMDAAQQFLDSDESQRLKLSGG